MLPFIGFTYKSLSIGNVYHEDFKSFFLCVSLAKPNGAKAKEKWQVLAGPRRGERILIAGVFFAYLWDSSVFVRIAILNGPARLEPHELAWALDVLIGEYLLVLDQFQ